MNLNELKRSPCSAPIGWERCGDIEFQNDEFKSDKKSPFCDAIGGCDSAHYTHTQPLQPATHIIVSPIAMKWNIFSWYAPK